MIIAVAGMEGALPSLVAGLVRVPVIAVPTSVGYGAHFGGVAPLLTMLNSCAPGIGVVNIDNGFGAAALASRINHVGRQPRGRGHPRGTLTCSPTSTASRESRATSSSARSSTRGSTGACCASA